MKSFLVSHSAHIRQLALVLAMLMVSSVAVPCWGESPTLDISPSLTLVPAKQGQEGQDVIKVTSGGSFYGNVKLTVSGLPSSVGAWWSNSSIGLSGGTGYSTLTLAPSATTDVNWYAFTITASGDGVSVSRSYALQVRPAQAVQIELSSSALTLWHGGESSLFVTAAKMNGVPFASGAAAPHVELTSSLPSGVASYWTGPTASGSGTTWQLHLSAATWVEAGSHPIWMSVRITDSQSGLVYTTSQNFQLLISLVASANFNPDGTTGPAISATFMGLSHEWWDAQWMMGDSATGVNYIYRQLLSNLTAYGSAPLNLRIGGVSTDDSGEPTSTTVTPFAQLADDMGVKFDLGVNLGSDDVGLAVNQAKNYIANMPKGSVDGLEIGNEPDLYAYEGLRWPTYTVENYFSDFETWKNNILPAVPAGTKVMGTAWASTGMLGNIGTFLSENSSALGVFSQHGGVTTPSSYPPVNILLQPNSATMEPINVAAAVEKTHADGIPFRIGEIAAADLSGISGISNAFSCALWEVDTMFEYVNVGVDGINWSSGISGYSTPFLFTTSTSNGYTTYKLTSVNAPYYGLLLFQAATGNGAKILPVDFSAQANVKAWGTIDRSGTPRVVLIDKDESVQGNVSVSMPGYSHASVYRLTAPSYTSTSGIQFAGQTFDGSTDGKIHGYQSVETLYGSNGAFEVPIGTASAALLVFGK